MLDTDKETLNTLRIFAVYFRLNQENRDRLVTYIYSRLLRKEIVLLLPEKDDPCAKLVQNRYTH